MSHHDAHHPTTRSAGDRYHPAGADRLDPDPELLVDLLPTDAGSVLCGFEPTSLHLDVHVAALPDDPRTFAAGLFGLVAAPRWCAVGVAVSGTIDGPDADVLADGEAHEASRTQVNARVVVTRSAEVAARLDHDVGTPDTHPEAVPPEPARIGASSGIVIDALHRALGLRCPGEPPAAAMVAFDLWLDRVVAQVIRGGPTSWPAALSLHPGDPGPGTSNPSLETIVESTIRSADAFSWERIRRRVAGSQLTMGDLSAAEAAWMDEVMFGRWVIDSLLPSMTYLRILEDLDAGEVARQMAAVADAIEQALSRPGAAFPTIGGE